MNKIGFSGAGNMAGSIIGGLLNAGYTKNELMASDPAADERAKQLGIEVTDDNQLIADWADVIVLAVKPQILKSVCTEIAEQVGRNHNLMISIAAGIRSDDITNWLGTDAACVRVMPNTPSLVGLGMSGLYANAHTSKRQTDVATSIMQTVGQVIHFDEEPMIDAVTAVSGSGPAYFFLFMEAMIKAATQQGISAADAKTLVLQTALGAATMASESSIDTEELRRRVTSPGGTTERAIQTLLDGERMQTVNNAIDAAAKRSVELSVELAGNNNE